MKEKLLALANQLDEIADLPRDYEYTELGEWFVSWGSNDVYKVASQLRQLAKEIK